MPLGKELSAKEKIQIEAFREAGKSYGYISKKLKRSRSTVSDFVLLRLGKIPKKRKGRPRKICARDERHISRSLSNETKSLNDVKAECSLNVHKSTICRAVKRISHIVRQKMKTAPKLDAAHRRDRIDFARQNMALIWNLVSSLLRLTYTF